MSAAADNIRDQQRTIWDQFSAGWRKWDAEVLGWHAPFGDALIEEARLRPDSAVLDVACGTGEPGLTAAGLVPEGSVTLTDISEGMLRVAREKPRPGAWTTCAPWSATPPPCRSTTAPSTPSCAASASCSSRTCPLPWRRWNAWPSPVPGSVPPSGAGRRKTRGRASFWAPSPGTPNCRYRPRKRPGSSAAPPRAS